MTVRVKICGITNLNDAEIAAEAGADYLGFIFWPKSKRSVSVEVAQEIVHRLRQQPAPPGFVGVFVNEEADTVAGILDTCNLDLAQLSGDEPPGLVGDPSSPLYGRSYKALRPSSLAEAEAEAEWYVPPRPVEDRPALLLDAYHPTLYGGTGQRVDWQIAARLVETVKGVMLAGGLTPENVAEAIAQVQPFAVDVASGVEAAPGRKDHERVRAFIHNARQAARAQHE